MVKIKPLSGEAREIAFANALESSQGIGFKPLDKVIHPGYLQCFQVISVLKPKNILKVYDGTMQDNNFLELPLNETILLTQISREICLSHPEKLVINIDGSDVIGMLREIRDEKSKPSSLEI